MTVFTITMVAGVCLLALGFSLKMFYVAIAGRLVMSY